jgi:hypothetical protein
MCAPTTGDSLWPRLSTVSDRLFPPRQSASNSRRGRPTRGHDFPRDRNAPNRGRSPSPGQPGPCRQRLRGTWKNAPVRRHTVPGESEDRKMPVWLDGVGKMPGLRWAGNVSGLSPCDRLSLVLVSCLRGAPREDGLPCRPLGGCMASPLPSWPPVLWLQKCCLPIFRSGHMGIRGVTLRHLERRALMLFRSAKSWTERQLKQAA